MPCEEDMTVFCANNSLLKTIIVGNNNDGGRTDDDVVIAYFSSDILNFVMIINTFPNGCGYCEVKVTAATTAVIRDILHCLLTTHHADSQLVHEPI